jgi:hypothetical protein
VESDWSGGIGANIGACDRPCWLIPVHAASNTLNAFNSPWRGLEPDLRAVHCVFRQSLTLRRRQIEIFEKSVDGRVGWLMDWVRIRTQGE